MSNVRDDEPAYIFCNAETKEKVIRRSQGDAPPDDAFVVADIIPPGYCVVAAKHEFLGWLFEKGNDHNVLTIPTFLCEMED